MKTEDLYDGVVYDGEVISGLFQDRQFCLTMLDIPTQTEDYETWLARERRKPKKSALIGIQILMRTIGDERWTFVGMFGQDDEINYSLFNTDQARELLIWLDECCSELGFCAPIPGSSCYRGAPGLP